VIGLQIRLPREIRQEDDFEYVIRAINRADRTVGDVVVLHWLPAGVSLVGSSPQAESRERVISWRLGDMEVQEAREIRVRARSTALGSMTFCCDAQYRAPLCATVQSTRPQLAVTAETLPEATRCDEVPLKIAVTNEGTARCTDVLVRVALAPGMVGPDGSRDYAFRTATLEPGQTRRTQIVTRAERVGVFVHRVSAAAAEGLRADTTVETRIGAPALAVTQTGPDKQLTGREITYEFSVRNSGDMVARDVVIQDRLPAGAEVVSVRPGSVEPGTGGALVWRLPELLPGAGVGFAVTVRPKNAGTYANHVDARAFCADDVSAVHTVPVTGFAAILLEMVDLDDPVEVGNLDTYVITATNQGTSTNTGITIRCQLEEKMEYVSSEGPTATGLSGRELTFAPLPSLAPGAGAVWKVTCRAVADGDVRFRVIMTSDQLQRPVEETEATRFY
jgi:uncharacterized repeat protein (TIGR01451 family)